MNGIIRQGKVVDTMGEVAVKDIYIKDGCFAAPFDGPYELDIDAAGKVVMPGLVDAHAHLRDPGFEYREDIITGTRSAAHGGFTSVACMPNTKPVCDNAAVVTYIVKKSKSEGYVNVFP
ncbi:MAG TPA: amidohydrolase family protein, partial [Clostridiaceae bacterium]|nr:amidohydrolase family protein [Clostridiaceae bacterium]